jgi:hypothetical protein
MKLTAVENILRNRVMGHQINLVLQILTEGGRIYG